MKKCRFGVQKGVLNTMMMMGTTNNSSPVPLVQRKTRYCLRWLIYIAIDIGISFNKIEINNDTGNTTSDIKNMT